MKKLILASGSAYRKLLLQRLRLPFEAVSPQLEGLPLIRLATMLRHLGLNPLGNSANPAD